MGGPRKLGGERRGVGTSLKVGMRSDRANYLKTGLKLVPTRVRYGVKMTPQGPLIVQFGPLSLALHPASKLGKSGARLGKWFRVQRMKLIGKYNDEKYKLFDYHGFDLDPIGNKWTEHFLELGEYYSQNRELPARGTRLGDWAYTQKKQPALTEMKKREAGELVMFGRINWVRHPSR